MNLNYAKVALYAYPNLEAIMEQIDDLVEKKAYASMNDFQPCEVQCEKIIRLTEQKDIIIQMKITIDKLIKKFSSEEYDLLDYKYFMKKDRKYFDDKDTSSRKYFRKQISVAKKFAQYLEKAGYDDLKFQKECFKIEFFRELLKRVIEHEKLSRKNKTRKEKLIASKNKIIISNDKASIA